MQCDFCGTQYDPKDTNLQYCTQCGWTLCHLEYTQDPLPVSVHGEESAEFTVLLQNVGMGELFYELGSLPRGLKVLNDNINLSNRMRLPTGGTQTLRLAIEPDGLQDMEQKRLVLPIRTTDRRGTSPTEYRPIAHEIDHTREIILELDRRTLGPIEVEQELLLFRQAHQPQYLHLYNEGEAHTILNLHATGGFLLSLREQDPPKAQITFLLEEKRLQRVRVIAPPQKRYQSEAEGQISITGQGVRSSQQPVHLHCIYPKIVGRPTEKWLIGIDFGTSKTAVFVKNSFEEDMAPEPILWQKEDALVPAVPSKMLYQFVGGSPLFGYEVPDSPLIEDTLYRSFKTLLYQDEVDSVEREKRIRIVSDFLFRIRSQIKNCQQFDNEDILEDARLIMSLPILDSDAIHEEQKRQTTQAADEAGFDTSKIEWVLEPEAAAIDFLERRNEIGMHIKDGDYICVFDSGAGTTDISILRVTFVGEVPTFTPVVRVGYPFAGDLVDALLSEDIKGKIPANKNLEELLTDVRNAKHQLAFPKSLSALNPTQVVTFGKDAFDTEVSISWDKVKELYVPYVSGMLERGIQKDMPCLHYGNDHQPTLQPVEKEYPPLRLKMQEAGVPANQIKWLCLVGGSAFIPCVIDALQNTFRKAVILPPLQAVADQQETPQPDFTLNVARGATHWLLRHIEGQMPCDIYISYETNLQTKPKEKLLQASDHPGKQSSERQCRLEPNEQIVLRVYTPYQGESRCIYTWRQTNATDSSIDIRYRLLYNHEHKILLQITQNGTPEEHTILC